MEDKKYLSVVTVNYNNAEGLRLTAESVANQDTDEVEWIVIDGGSTDGSREVIENYSRYIGYSVSEQDRGIYHAMNKGVEAATGKYLIFLNSGDCFYDSNTVSDFLKRGSTEDVVYGKVEIVNAQGVPVRQTVIPSDPLLPTYFWDHNLNHQGIFFSRRCFESIRYNEALKISADRELILTLLYQKYTFGSYDRLIALYDNTGISSTPEGLDQLGKEFHGILQRVFPEGILDVLEQNIKYQHSMEVDIARMSFDLMNSNKLIRYLTRIFLIPIHAISKIIK